MMLASIYIQQNREVLVTAWEKRARREIDAAENSKADLLRNHLIELLEDLSKSLEYASVSKEPRESSQKFFIKSRSDRHGESRSESRDSYEVDTVLEEYVIFRQVITDQLLEKDYLDIDCLEALNTMFELSSLNAVKVFKEKSEKSTQRIISTLVHDIRSPIGVAISALEMLENFLTPNELGKEMYGMVARSLDRSLDMVTISLDHFSVESRSKLTLKFEEVELSKALNTVLQDLDQVYGSRLIRENFERNINGVFAQKILVRILENLISNAFKFGDTDGSVTVSLINKDDEVHLSVHNLGEPIKNKNLDKIFEMFQSTSKSKKISAEGWGLGLSHVQLAAKAHGGSVSVSSSAISGTEFKIILKKNFQEVGEKQFKL